MGEQTDGSVVSGVKGGLARFWDHDDNSCFPDLGEMRMEEENIK